MFRHMNSTVVGRVGIISEVILDRLEAPVILAPLGGGPSPPELAAGVLEAGGFGFLASAYLSAETLGERIGATRSLTDRPIGVNIFVPGAGPAERRAYEDFLGRLAAWSASTGAPLGEPRFSDDDWEAKLELLLAERLPIVS